MTWYQRTINELEWAELDSRNEPDTRRMMRDERFALLAASTKTERRAATKEAHRVATMWGVDLEASR